jgi:hypothetical protein
MNWTNNHKHVNLTPEKAAKHAKAERTKTQKFEQSNRVFAAENKAFRAACSEAGVEPTKRQASKYRNKLGVAYRNV